MIPEAIYNFNIYDSTGTKMWGSGDELKLPDLQSKTSTMSGGGMLGDIESPLLGIYGSIEFEIPQRMLNEEAFSFIKKQSKGAGVMVRGAQQITDAVTHEIDHRSMRVVIRGRNKAVNFGKLKQGESMDASIKLEVTYLLVEIEGKKMFELDKFNSVLVIDGEDQLAKIRRMC